jgi:Cell division protein 48 (CDC48), domain 2
MQEAIKKELTDHVLTVGQVIGVDSYNLEMGNLSVKVEDIDGSSVVATHGLLGKGATILVVR